MKKIAIFASGNGSNFEAIVRYPDKKYEVALLITDNEKAYAVKRAEYLGIPFLIFNPRDFKDKNDYEVFLVRKLRQYEVDFIVLAGYMRIIGSKLLSAYENKIINIHPSLLPAFKGKDAISQAFLYGVKVTGVTIHLVNQDIDSGMIIEQIPFYINNKMTINDLEKEIHKIEHANYPIVINKFSEEGVL